MSTQSTKLTKYLSGEANDLPKAISVDAVLESFQEFESRISKAKIGRDRAGVAACLVMYSSDLSQSQVNIVNHIAEKLNLRKEYKCNMKGAFLNMAKRFNPQGDNPAQEAVVLARELCLARGFTASGGVKPGHCPRTGSVVNAVEVTPKKTKDANKAAGPVKVITDNQGPENETAQESTLSVIVTLLNALSVLQQRVKGGDIEAKIALDKLAGQDLASLDIDSVLEKQKAA